MSSTGTDGTRTRTFGDPEEDLSDLAATFGENRPATPEHADLWAPRDVTPVRLRDRSVRVERILVGYERNPHNPRALSPRYLWRVRTPVPGSSHWVVQGRPQRKLRWAVELAEEWAI